MTATTIETLADLVERLGGIPLHRIRFQPAPGTATEDDLWREYEGPRKRLCELVEGVLVEKAMGWEESSFAGILIGLLNAFVVPRNLGVVTGEAGFYRLFPNMVRGPDVAFASWDRMPGRRRPQDKALPLAPNLAVEVLSEGNTPAEMDRKLREYFSAGVTVVWIVNPVARTVRVYSDPEHYQEHGENDSLDGGPALPGFILSLRDWFAELDRQG